MHFHVSREARDRYGIEAELFTLTGNVVLPDFAATRRLVQRMNERRRAGADEARALEAGDLNAVGLIDEILHYVVVLYREQRNPDAMRQALAALERRLGRKALDATLLDFVDRFPTAEVHAGDRPPAEWLADQTDGRPNREIALEEVLTLWLANANAAFDDFAELFDDEALAGETAYRQLITGLQAFFAAQPPFGPDQQSLVSMLRSPAVAVPDSLAGQLRFIRERWGLLIGRFIDRLLIGLDVLEEEALSRWRRFHPGGDGHAAVLEFTGLGDAERFSADRDWMPRVVLMAKSSYVWLDQLSRAYARDIHRLDQIPDEELDRLARWGFTGLWLIGLWERSEASAEIKRRRGNPEAVASAYSLKDYRIADDLGGETAFRNLRERAAVRGIRLASDMVPNHMGIDSQWVIEHPDWFLSLDEPPYPSYGFNGPDLARDERVGVFIEDHYWDGSDAAVVFKRLDKWTGDARFIYHGNDGTSTPWNDTAQLNYLRHDVREAVIQTILEVARRFPIIRFDAAMTLAKKHIQRLWFPAPGSGGGAIPSRAERAMSGADFDAAMPIEFWREVVDRVASEVPDTLLLAEAFWLMEGYFVRTLGMHRVYNSAFMNMLRDERNAEYRQLIKNTLEFDPEILRRYVNFMNNPDERTAVDQFGKGDKYVGIATLMATLPGLPMFGHGQVEGFGEKYGMEYRRAYHDEPPDPWLVERHERQIFPLLHRRALFADVRDFNLYDLVTDGGTVNEDVFAYSNRSGDGRALVVFHNRYAATAGWLRDSVAFAVKDWSGGKRLVRRSLGEGLGLSDDPAGFVIFGDARSGLEHLRPTPELRERGLWVELDAYRCHVFWDFREVHDAGGQYRRLHDHLGGRGVPGVEDALRRLQLQPLHDAIARCLDPELIGQLADVAGARPPEQAPAASGRRRKPRASKPAQRAEVAEALAARAAAAYRAAGETAGMDLDPGATAATVRHRAAALIELAVSGPADGLVANLRQRSRWGPLVAWLVLAPMAAGRGEELIETFRLREPLAGALRGLGLDEAEAWRAVELLGLLLAGTAAVPEAPAPAMKPGRDGRPRKRRAAPRREAAGVVAAWLDDPRAQRLLGVNWHEGTAWFGREAFEELGWWSLTARLIRDAGADGGPSASAIATAEKTYRATLDLAERSGYRLDRLTKRSSR